MAQHPGTHGEGDAGIPKIAKCDTFSRQVRGVDAADLELADRSVAVGQERPQGISPVPALDPGARRQRS